MAEASGYLYASYQTGDSAMGTGISAMPSMHLAIVTLNACMLTSLNRHVGVLAWIYVALIQLGSVYLGWHYALDGYFSIAAVGLIWWGVGRVTTRLGVATRPQPATAGAGS
jgi:membrane-associated phospholipid phosphatase